MTDANNMRRYLKLFEAVAPDYVGPKASDTVTYAAEQTKGQITKITATLKSYDSARYTKLGRNLLRIEALTEEIKTLQTETKAEARELVADLFNAEDAACTRVVDTVGFMFHMSKDPVASGSVSYSKVLDELQAHLTPELISILETLKAKHTSAPVQRAASLKATDKAAQTEESIVEGIGDKLVGFFKKLYQSIKAWGVSYDSKLDALKAEVGIMEELEEGWAEERQKFFNQIANRMNQELDSSLIRAIEATDITPDEWQMNPINCIMRIRGAQEELNSFESIQEDQDDGWYTHHEMYGKISKEDWKKGWRYNHLKKQPFFNSNTKTWHDNISEETTEFNVGDVVRINAERSQAHGEYGMIDAIDEAPEDQGGNIYKVVLIGTGYWAEYEEHELEMSSEAEARAASRLYTPVKESDDCDHEWVEGVDDDGNLEEPAYDVCVNCGEIRD